MNATLTGPQFLTANKFQSTPLKACGSLTMDEEAKAHRRREIDERRKKLELMRAQRATRSKTSEAALKVR